MTVAERRARAVELALDLMRANERARTTNLPYSGVAGGLSHATTVEKVTATTLVTDAKRIEKFLKTGE